MGVTTCEVMCGLDDGMGYVCPEPAQWRVTPSSKTRNAYMVCGFHIDGEVAHRRRRDGEWPETAKVTGSWEKEQ